MIKELDSAKSIAHAFFQFAEKNPERLVYSQAIIDESDSPERPREKVSRNYAEVSQRVRKLTQYLQQTGVERGEKVAIFSSSRPEWLEADLAILALGGVTISVYQSLPAEDAGYILFDSGAEVVFAENQEQVEKLLELSKGPIHIPGTEERPESEQQLTIRAIISFDPADSHDLVSQFEEIVSGDDAPESIEGMDEIQRGDLAALVYTSGTTGPPKGVMQTHENHLANVRQVWQAKLIEGHSSIMLFLPLAHSFARLMGYLGLLTPASLCFAGIADRRSSKMNPSSVTKDIAEAGATVVPVVPRLLEKMQAGIQHKATAGGVAGFLVSNVLGSAREVYEAKENGKAPGFKAKLVYSLTTPIRESIQKKLFGEAFEFAVSGGAKLNPQVARFFDSIGIEIVEGYGLTETCVATNVNLPGRKKIGTVGKVLADDIQLRLCEDGEILYKGPNVTSGYYGRETATRSSWDDEGWFHTGDLGAVDDDGYLSIVGRKKEIIVTSYGKNIAPEDIEAQIKTPAQFSQALLVGDGRPYCVALVTVDDAAVQAWAAKAGVTVVSGQYDENEDLKKFLWSEIEKVNAELASYETVKKFAIIPEDFTVDNGFLTPTFKVKRNFVQKQYAELIDRLYAE
jgi:long-chain acyl-CoA synthetase